MDGKRGLVHECLGVVVADCRADVVGVAGGRFVFEELP